MLMDGDYLSIHQSALTGELLPLDKGAGVMAYSGSVIKQGEMSALVSAGGGYRYFVGPMLPSVTALVGSRDLFGQSLHL
jgi:magnesium-transporting ATPase (P-type)